MITTFEQLHQRIRQGSPKRVAVAAPENPTVLEAISRAQNEGLAQFVLLGSSEKLKDLQLPYQPAFEVIESEDPARDSVRLIREGGADLLMKGRVSTGDLLGAVLDREKGLRQGDLLNHIAAVQSPQYHKLLFISDGGINIHLDEKVQEQMVRNDAAYLKLLGIDAPKFGIMSIIEYVNPKIPETVMAQNVVTRLQGEYLVEGPIAPDVALSRLALEKKGLESNISGDVDVFIMPNTASANFIIKGLVFLGGCKVGGVIVGAKVPIILLSRSDDAETRYRSILLGLV